VEGEGDREAECHREQRDQEAGAQLAQVLYERRLLAVA